MKQTLSSKLYFGHVFHSRLRPVKHRLKYSVFSMLVDLDEFSKLDEAAWCFSINRFNLFSIHERDHGGGLPVETGAKRGDTLRAHLSTIIKNADLEGNVERIKMLCYPRIFGYAFNPLTVYFCLDGAGVPLLMVYEVRNTFGEHCTYVVRASEKVGKFFHQNCEKHFYVSPFNEVKGHYNFTHSGVESEKLIVRVDLMEDNLPTINTCFSGDAYEFSTASLLKAFFKHPLMSLKIVAGIHWEALKLWRKGMGLQERPKVEKRRLFMFT